MQEVSNATDDVEVSQVSESPKDDDGLQAALRAMKEVADKHGFKLAVRRIRGIRHYERFVSMHMIPHGIEEREREKFARLAPKIGLSPDDFGKSVLVNDRPFRIVGIDVERDSGKYKVRTTTLQGKLYRMTTGMIRLALKNAA